MGESGSQETPSGLGDAWQQVTSTVSNEFLTDFTVKLIRTHFFELTLINTDAKPPLPPPQDSVGAAFPQPCIDGMDNQHTLVLQEPKERKR